MKMEAVTLVACLLSGPILHAEKWVLCTASEPVYGNHVTHVYLSDAFRMDDNVQPFQYLDGWDAFVKSHYSTKEARPDCEFTYPTKGDADTARDRAAERSEKNGFTVIFTHWTY